ncbi:uncharacterized protein At4g15970-like [Phragmites australis]|uniref:uncharacterized protein At4g15970-like n=1 Tax=Phragmites australis TaxID=29695 RepID=UPI002D78FC51|nr:uncharacterized protein At4g15970-like [Phragmites australis]
MNTVRNLLRFFLISSIACIAVLVLQRSPCPCRDDVPAHKELALGTNGSRVVDPSMKKPGMADEDKLPEVLRRAAMEDKTIIMTFTNEAFAAPGSLMDLFLESFRTGVRTEPLLKHLIIVAADAKAFERCQLVHPLCYALPVGGANFTSEQVFMVGDYLDMMWRRNRFQARVLELGYSFVFTDVDIVWFRNPLLRIPVGVDFAMSSDSFYGDNPYDLNKRANGGFVYSKASARTVAFYGGWYEARKAYPGKNEQDLFDKLKRELSAAHGVAAQFVDTAYLGGFCERRKNIRDFNKLCTFHGNCLVGIKSKLEKLRGVLDEWKRFKASNGTILTD